MSNERREPTFGGGVEPPELTPPPAQQAPDTQPGAEPSARKKSKPHRSAQSGSNGTGMAWFAFFIAVIGLSASGYLYWQGQQYRLQANTVAEDMGSRLAQLEKRLDFTDEESSQSVEAIRAKLKWADSEIRKLWGVSNDRNRKAIAAHKKQIASLQKSLANAVANARNATSKGTANAKALASLDQQLKDQIKIHGETAAALDKAETQLQAQNKSLEDLLKDVKSQAISLDQLQNGLLERVQMNEDAIESITVYRKTNNREILNIKKRLDRLPAKPAP